LDYNNIENASINGQPLPDSNAYRALTSGQFRNGSWASS